MLLYPSSRAINVKALADRFISLGQPRRINLQLYSNQNEVRDCKISIKAATAGLRLRIHQTEMVNNKKDSLSRMVLDKDGDIRLSNIDQNKKVDLAIPYTLESVETMLLVMNLQITYSNADGTFVYYDSVSINTILPISVNVQELFRATELLSRFTISPATLVPIQLTNCSIDGGDQYEVEAGIEIDEPWAVFPKQPASLVYRSTKKLGAQQASKTEPLPLLVDYECIDEIILSAVETRFTEEVNTSPFAHLSHLLTSHLLEAYRTKWTEQDLEVALLLREISIWPFSEINWDEILRGLPSHVQKDILPWLQSWHAQTAPISLDNSTAPTRRISIPIEIPTPRVVVTASLEPSYTGPAIAVGQPVIATLSISFTDHWRSRPASKIETESEEIDISYELLASPEQWLLGGRRKGNATSLPHVTHAFQILLLPQRVGSLMFPGLEVKCFSSGGTGEEIHCELDWKGVGRSVLVVAGLGSVTVGLDGDGGGGEAGAWVVGSERLKSLT